MAKEDQKTGDRIQLAAVSPSAGVTRRLKKISGVEGGMAESMSRLGLFVVSEICGSSNLQADVQWMTKSSWRGPHHLPLSIVLAAMGLDR